MAGQSLKNLIIFIKKAAFNEAALNHSGIDKLAKYAWVRTNTAIGRIHIANCFQI